MGSYATVQKQRTIRSATTPPTTADPTHNPFTVAIVPSDDRDFLGIAHTPSGKRWIQVLSSKEERMSYNGKNTSLESLAVYGRLISAVHLRTSSVIAASVLVNGGAG